MMRWWVALWDHQDRPVGLAWVRVLLPLVLLFDLGQAWVLDLVEVLWSPPSVGGLPANLLLRDPLPEVYRWFAPEPSTAVALHALTCLSLALMALGVFSRLTSLTSLLLYAQLGLILPLGDRGIDLLCRNVLMILAFAPCGEVLSFDAWRKTGSIWGDGRAHPAWARHLLILQLFVVYWMAGVQKVAITWTPLGGYHALYIILQDPHIARFDFTWLRQWWPLSSIATGTTHIWEWSAPLIPISMWFRLTHDRPGRIRALFNRYKVLHVYIAFGVVLHLGIHATMNLGIFPWAMIAIYPVFFHADEHAAAWGWVQRRLGRGGPAAA